MKHLNFQQTNDLLAAKLQEGKPFSCMRIDNTSGFIIQRMFHGSNDFSGFFSDAAQVEGGVYPFGWETSKRIYQDTLQVVRRADISGFVDLSGEISRDSALTDYICEGDPNKPMFFGPDFLVMDPGALLSLSDRGPCINPWTQYLAGKKVLVITSHAESIKYQWEKIDQVWGENRKIIAPFDLAGVIRSPYHPLMDDRQPPNCSNWYDMVDYVMDKMDEIDYDVLLSGSTTNSPFFAEYAKSRGKVGIQTGGTLQLFFGVYGFRWTKVAGYNAWHQMYNEHWMYPLEIDKPQRVANFAGLETTFAYW